jgi:hypothetical protein
VLDDGVTRAALLPVVEDQDALAVSADDVAGDQDVPGVPDEDAELVSDVWTVSVSWVLLKTRPVQTGHVGNYLNEASAYSYNNSGNNHVILSRARLSPVRRFRA